MFNRLIVIISFIVYVICSPNYNKLEDLHKNKYDIINNQNHLKSDPWIQNLDSTFSEVDDLSLYTNEHGVRHAWLRDRVRSQHYLKRHMVSLAADNMKRVLSTAECKIPTRRCLDVNNLASSDSNLKKSFWPNCALVHKCGHDSGCCKLPGQVCSPVTTENIHLYFFVVEDSKQSAQMGRVERLAFENHTSCDCKTDQNNRITVAEELTCECPLGFNPVGTAVDCRCDCNKKKDKTCRRIKRGRRSYFARGCRGKCAPPICNFGEFKDKFGRCPRKHERARGR